MSNMNDVLLVIVQLGGSKNAISVNQVLCRFMGGLEGGVFLAQLLYWSDRGGSDDGWFYKTYPEWYEETFITEYKIRDIRKKCEEMGFLDTTLRKANGNPTVHYRLNVEKLVELLADFVGKEKRGGSGIESLKSKKPNFEIKETDTENPKKPNGNSAESITEITTEITREDNREGSAAAQQPATPAKKSKGKKKDPESDPNSKHPLIQAYRDIYEKYPESRQMKAIIEADPPLDNWIRAIRAWNLTSYSPTNFAGMLDWAFSPSKIGGGPTPTSNKRTTNTRAKGDDHESSNSDNQWDPEELERIKAEKRAREAAVKASVSSGSGSVSSPPGNLRL